MTSGEQPIGERQAERVRAANAKLGVAYFFVRRSGAPVARGVAEALVATLNAASAPDPIGFMMGSRSDFKVDNMFRYHDDGHVYLGHAAWGFLFSDHTYMCGSLENTTGNPVVTGRDSRIAAQYWKTYKRCSQHRPPTELLAEMSRMGYAKQHLGIPISGYSEYVYKEFHGAQPNPAEACANRWADGHEILLPGDALRGPTEVYTSYSVIAQNCLDNAVEVLNAYKASMPRPLTNAWFPNDYFDMLRNRGWSWGTL